MGLILRVLTTGMFGSNSYIIGDRGEGVIIDAGVDVDEIMEAVKETGLSIKFIILTHGHIDHICSVDKYRARLGAPIYIHEADSEYLQNPNLNVSGMLGKNLNFDRADKCLTDGDLLQAGGLKYTILHTPGHTPGCICIKVDEVLFTGDTLFRASVGRTDLSGGDHEALIHSIHDKLMVLGEDVIVYPGHGPTTTIGFEKINNPYI